MQKQTFSAKALGNEYATGVSRPAVLTTKTFLPHQRVTTEGKAMKVGKTKCNPSTNDGQANSVTIGNITISQFGDGSVWLEDGDEDAGSFDEALLAEHIKEFYDENL
ncbi:hypothetical protein HLI26_07360 [Salmonella enterica subsp. enterica]|uniref:hypothetical protein n=1 Tax=Salmonella enterica TaxID=28901 RepID=UPI002151E0CC|nr:hypothetical protein [Salmonella enterica]MCR6026798.1 hypothetical protein [Salmonella enterica subsp. enterica]